MSRANEWPLLAQLHLYTPSKGWEMPCFGDVNGSKRSWTVCRPFGTLYSCATRCAHIPESAVQALAPPARTDWGRCDPEVADATTEPRVETATVATYSACGVRPPCTSFLRGRKGLPSGKELMCG